MPQRPVSEPSGSGVGNSAWARVGVLSLAALAGWPRAAQAQGVTFIYPDSPAPWVLIVFLLGVLALAVAAILFWMRFLFGDKRVRLPVSIKQDLEKHYADKLREEFKKKNEDLNKRVTDVRRQYSMVLMKVKGLSTTLDSNSLFKGIIEMLQQEVNASKFILFLFDREKKELYPFRWEGYADEIIGKLNIPLDRDHVLTHAFSRRQMVYRLAAADDPETRGLVGREPLTEFLLALPLASMDECFGVIHIEEFRDGKTQVDDVDLRFFSSLGSFIGIALGNANVFLQTKDELTSTKQLSEKEVSEKKRLKEMFSRYTSGELVEALLKNPGSVNLGGTTKVATILFSDIAGFTNFSSRLTPEQVVQTINEYLSRMTEVVLDHDGEIDKFIGDAVMARFGVLGNLPASGLSAVRAALAMLEELRRLQTQWAAENRQTFSIRIGIATGPVLAGNIGSERRQEFTVMGTTVNLASRLEALNKELRTTILVDEQTYQQISAEVKALPRENISIRGLEGTMRVYEVLGFREGYGGKSKIISLKDKIAQNRAGQEKSGGEARRSIESAPEQTERQQPRKSE